MIPEQPSGQTPFSELVSKRGQVAEGTEDRKRLEEAISEAIKKSPFERIYRDGERLYRRVEIGGAEVSRQVVGKCLGLLSEVEEEVDQIADPLWQGVDQELIAKLESLIRRAEANISEKGVTAEVTRLVEARLQPIGEKVGELQEKLETAEFQVNHFREASRKMKEDIERLRDENKAATEALAKERKRAGKRTGAVVLPEFEGTAEEERDNKRIDYLRGFVEQASRGEVEPSRYEERLYNLVTESIENPETKKKVRLELSIRRGWSLLAVQWEQASGNDESIGRMIGKARSLRVPWLIRLSHLESAKDGDKGERVSLSVQLSRATNIYLNFLGVWAEAFGSEEPKTLERSKKGKGKDEIVVITKKIADYTNPFAIKAQERLASLSATNEGRIPLIEQKGVKAAHLKRIINEFPDELRGYNTAFREQVGKAKEGDFFSLPEIFGKCMFSQEVTTEDILWTQSVVAGLCGSVSAEIMALEFLDFTGETDMLNIAWKDGAYRATDYQKLIRIEERRKREAASGNPFGYEVTLGKYPVKSGQGWMENAKFGEGEDSLNVRSVLKGEWDRTNNKWVREPTPFHKVDWNALPRDTYTVDFLLPNSRYYQVFEQCLREDLDWKDFTAGSLRKVNKAFKTAWGTKDNIKSQYPQNWVEHSPWVWYVIGGLSAHNPWGQKQLPGMSEKNLLSEMWLRHLDSGAMTSGKYAPAYEETVRVNLRRSGFLTREEIQFVEKYCS